MSIKNIELQEAYEIGYADNNKNLDDCPYCKLGKNGTIGSHTDKAKRSAYYDGWYDSKHFNALNHICGWDIKTQHYWR